MRQLGPRYGHQIEWPRPLQPGAEKRVHGRQDGVQELALPLALPGRGLGPDAVHDRDGPEVLREDGKNIKLLT